VRFDSDGLFWVDEPEPEKVRKTKEVVKRVPPERTWEHPDYLPGLEAAQRFDVKLFSDQELVDAAITRQKLVWDIECYSNYFLVCFRLLGGQPVVYFEMYDGCPLDIAKLAWVVKNFCMIGFNTRAYDAPMLQAALGGASCLQLKFISDRIIKEDLPGWQVLKEIDGIWEEPPNHIDLIEVAPLDASLKIYGGRLHARRMWDLPFPPETTLSRNQMLIVRWYCLNDLDLTEVLYCALKDQIDLREMLGQEYGADLRSLSDAQIAEKIITSELRKQGIKVGRTEVTPGTAFKYVAPSFIQFKTPYMQRILAQTQTLEFVVGDDGYSTMPAELAEQLITIGESQYQMGMGGLHSCEKSTAHIADGSFTLVDRDVASYYPAVILNCELYPEHLGPGFLKVYQNLVDKRLSAKRSGNKVVADCLKIVINGTFGKLGSKWSVLFSPNLLLQVTITGQLALLMLIESLELNGISVVSANTDGIVSKIPDWAEATTDQIVQAWEEATGFETEAVEYKALYSRDINNYIALKTDGKTKNKGAFANPWSEKYPSIFRMHKNPTTTICIEAVECFLRDGIALRQTIESCTDMRKFISIRTVRGGAVKDGVFLGKAIRWYYGVDSGGELIYASSGNKVAKSDGAIPMMTLSDTVPDNIDYDWYVAEAEEMLQDLGISFCQSTPELV